MDFLFGRKIRYIFLTIVIFLAIFLADLKVEAATTYVDCKCEINFSPSAIATPDFIKEVKEACAFLFGKPADSTNSSCNGAIIKFEGKDSQVTDCDSIDSEKVKKNYLIGIMKLKVDSSKYNNIFPYVEYCKAIGGSTSTSESGTSGSGSSAGSGMTATSLKKFASLKMNPGRIKSPQQLIGYAIKFDMAALGAIALALYIWAGFLWMTSGGNSERRDKAMKTLVWVTLGIIIMFASYLLMKFIFEQIILK